MTQVPTSARRRLSAVAAVVLTVFFALAGCARQRHVLDPQATSDLKDECAAYSHGDIPAAYAAAKLMADHAGNHQIEEYVQAAVLDGKLTRANYGPAKAAALLALNCTSMNGQPYGLNECQYDADGCEIGGGFDAEATQDAINECTAWRAHDLAGANRWSVAINRHAHDAAGDFYYEVAYLEGQQKIRGYTPAIAEQHLDAICRIVRGWPYGLYH